MNDVFISAVQAVERIGKGQMCVVVDDADRENEGDLVLAAEFATPENVNFMISHAKGLICAPMPKNVATRLGIRMAFRRNVADNTANFGDSVDLSPVFGVTTGVSAIDRSATLSRLACPSASADDFSSPGHVFPLIEDEGGIRNRRGHTEASVLLSRLAGLSGVSVICEIITHDGSMARGESLIEFCRCFELGLTSINELAKVDFSNLDCNIYDNFERINR